MIYVLFFDNHAASRSKNTVFGYGFFLKNILIPNVAEKTF